MRGRDGLTGAAVRRVWRPGAAIVLAVLALLPASAWASGWRAGFPATRAAARSHLTLAEAPAGLQAAVRNSIAATTSTGTSATTVFQSAKLTASGGSSGDQLGDSVALYGSTAVVGAPRKSSSTGAAYVFVQTKKGWAEQAELTAADGASGDEFGYAVALYGSTAVVGAPGRNSKAGAAYVFTHTSSGWSQQAELTASNGASGDQLGYSVAVYNLRALVGAPAANSNRGAAYVFVNTSSGWVQKNELTVAGSTSFGSSVALYGTTAVVGDPTNSTAVVIGGAAFVFVRTSTGWQQRATLSASDLDAGDEFGLSVAVYGSTVVVGAPMHLATGAAYVFASTSSGWSQQAELSVGNDLGSELGSSVAIRGSTAVVGAPYLNSQTGAAFVFVRTPAGWAQQATLVASDATGNEYLGTSVALYGSTALVGAPLKDSTGVTYVFAVPSESQLAASDTAGGDQFGYSVSISGSTAVVGAPFANSGAGVAYVFTHTSSGWSQQAELTAAGGVGGDWFGSSVSINGSTAVVGAPFANSQAGAAYVFTQTSTGWSQQAKLTASDAGIDDQFGSSVAVYGSDAVVGAPGRSSGAGAAYLFALGSTGWSQQAELTASDAAAGDAFGSSVALYGTTAVVGAPDKYSNGTAVGAAYVFANGTTGWSQQSELSASDGAASDQFGASVALYGARAIVGAPGRNSSTGAAYVFANGTTGWSQQSEVAASDAAAGDQFGYSVALYGSAALVGAPFHSSGNGAVYVFENGSAGWSQQAKLAPPAVGFGFSVGLYGLNAVIGAPGTDSDAGSAYEFGNV